MIILLTTWFVFGFIYTCALMAVSLDDVATHIYLTEKSVEKLEIYFRIVVMFLSLIVVSPFIFVVDEFLEA